VLKALLYGLKNMAKYGFKLLIRTEDFRIVGVLTAQKPEMDVSKGVPRMWGLGVDLDGKVFKEPLDRWVGEKGIYEYVILCENPQGVVVTCRRRPEGEEEDNFFYLLSPFEAGDVKKLEAMVAGKMREVSSLMRQLESMRKERDFWEREAKASGDEARELRDEVSRLSIEVAMLRSQIELYKRQAFAFEAFSTEVESTLRKILESAQEVGEDRGASEIERVSRGVKRLRELREEISGLVQFPSQPSEEEFRKIREDVKKIGEKLSDIEKSLPKKVET